MLGRNPCFNEKIEGICGRIHLPVAPRCNIGCNYCDRKFDCVNEGRPGVTSAVLSPFQAIRRLERVMEKNPHITVVGFAGPGDPFANAEEVLQTMRLVRERFPELLLCVSSNGLDMPPHLSALAEIDLAYATVTVNSVEPEVGRNILSWVHDGGTTHRGRQAVELLLERQVESIGGLKKQGCLVKVNTVVIPGINDRHVPRIAEKMAELGADVQNCMALYPNPGSRFGNLPEPSPEMMSSVRDEAGKFLLQLKHCRRCRADAIGLLREDLSGRFAHSSTEKYRAFHMGTEERPYVNVETRDGKLINRVVGETD